ncbi:hypothetical protein K470DRAFT_273864 [Piedraia hortae CBS 480.64]|uniref:Mitochondrial fission process protein 1 n=1 Tax=Piedraia hortae CBS 480.64 TaxID=1314780 RepID=A0A6A7CAI8_9PEZI|nr:hypothetical protein K470DRAFT_273864 [Piedraia hortae CBS 480.64]
MPDSTTTKAATIQQDEKPDFSKPLPRTSLPSEIQKTLDSEERWWELFGSRSDRPDDSTSSNVRYAGYARNLRTILRSAHRYVAYTSDIGESFRPVAHPYLVKSAYGISWAYIAGDVGYEGFKAYKRNQEASYTPPLDRWQTVVVQRGIFQSIASMGLPAMTIHSVVKYSGRAMKNVKNQRLRTWGPIGLGLSVVPMLPRLFDEPVERATEWLFYNTFKAVGGEKAVGGLIVHDAVPASGIKEKEL